MQGLNDNPKTKTINDSNDLKNSAPLKIDTPLKVHSDMSESASIRKLQICFLGIFVSYFIYGILQEKMLVLNNNYDY